MKRICIFLIAICLLGGCFSAFPVSAGPDRVSFAELSFTVESTVDGADPITGRVVPEQIFRRSPKITWNTARSALLVNDEPVDGGEVVLDVAGIYELSVTDVTDAAAKPYTYTVTVLPIINLEPDQTFTYYPTVTCSNANSFIIDKGIAGKEGETIFSQGDKPHTVEHTFEGLGRHSVTVCGVAPLGAVYEFKYFFYIRAVDVKQVWDDQLKKQALAVTVGSFEDLSIEATLDGEVLGEGTRSVTQVGSHSLSVLINGTPFESLYALPSAEELKLRVTLELKSLEQKEPFWLYLSQWDANFLLDGKPVSGDIRITEDGAHKLVVLDANGAVMEDIFLLLLETHGEPLVMDEVSFSFDNPHLTYAWFVAIPAAVLLVLALIFLLKRRAIV